jgi:hypothetical protein
MKDMTSTRSDLGPTSSRLRCLLAGILAVLPAVGFALDPGTARGELVIDGETIALTHSYALRQDNAEGLMDGPELRLLLSDRELATDLLAGPVLAELDRLARQGNVKGVLLRVDGERRPESVRGTILHAPPDPGRSLPFFTKSGQGAGFKRFELGDNRVVGEAEEAPEGPGFANMPVYGYRASFSAPIFEDRKVTAVLNGKEARASPPARAFLAFEKLLREGDLLRLQAAVTPARWRETEQYLAQVGEAQFKAEVRDMVPQTARRERQIERVVVRGDRATVIYREAGAKGCSFLVKDGVGWKIAG